MSTSATCWPRGLPSSSAVSAAKPSRRPAPTRASRPCAACSTPSRLPQRSKSWSSIRRRDDDPRYGLPGQVGTAVEAAGLIGQPLPRREDERILLGQTTYLDDIELPGLAHAAFVRSP